MNLKKLNAAIEKKLAVKGKDLKYRFVKGSNGNFTIEFQSNTGTWIPAGARQFASKAEAEAYCQKAVALFPC